MIDSQRQTCKACGRPDKFDFHVPDDVWAAVVPANLANRVVCLYCFDDFAMKNGVEYAEHIHTIYFAGDQATFIFHARIKLNGGCVLPD